MSRARLAAVSRNNSVEAPMLRRRSPIGRVSSLPRQMEAAGRPPRPGSSSAQRPATGRANQSFHADGRPPAAPMTRAATDGTASGPVSQMTRKSNPRQIVVSEKDLRRFGNDIQRLRECDVSAEREAAVNERAAAHKAAAAAAMSFKDVFAEKCRAEAEIRDPWDGLENPDEWRQKTEQDLVLNQVWFNPSKLAAASIDERSVSASTRASSTDGMLSPDREGSKSSVRRPPLSRPVSSASPPSTDGGLSTGLGAYSGVARGTRRRLKMSPLALAGAEACGDGVTRALSRKGSLGSSDRAPSAPPLSSGSAPSSGRGEGIDFRSSQKELPKPTYENGDAYVDPLDFGCGSYAVKLATRRQTSFIRHLDERQMWGRSRRTAWVLLDSQSGEVKLYPQAAADRLETSRLQGRASVPLSGTAPDLEGTIVKLHGREETDSSVHISPDGHQVGEVQRIELTGASLEPPLRLHVVCNHDSDQGSTDEGSARGAHAEGGQWRFASAGQEATEEREILFHASELAEPDRAEAAVASGGVADRKLYFINMPEFE